MVYVAVDFRLRPVWFSALPLMVIFHRERIAARAAQLTQVNNAGSAVEVLLKIPAAEAAPGDIYRVQVSHLDSPDELAGKGERVLSRFPLHTVNVDRVELVALKNVVRQDMEWVRWKKGYRVKYIACRRQLFRHKVLESFVLAGVLSMHKASNPQHHNRTRRISKCLVKYGQWVIVIFLAVTQVHCRKI